MPVWVSVISLALLALSIVLSGSIRTWNYIFRQAQVAGVAGGMVLFIMLPPVLATAIIQHTWFATQNTLCSIYLAASAIAVLMACVGVKRAQKIVRQES